MSTGPADLRTIVKACAQSPPVVEECNRMHGLTLECPIRALVEDRYPLEVSTEEALQIERFILYVVEIMLTPRQPAQRRKSTRRTKASRRMH